MSFPFLIDDIAEYNGIIIPKEYGINYNTGQLTGKIVEGIEAVKVWVYLTLNVERYKYIIYSWDYGNELDSIIGTSFPLDYLQIEYQRLIEDALFVNPYITNITNFVVTLKDADKVQISFMVNTTFGEVEINV